ncbi:neuropeptides capa receptor-like [Battus philenor]|uniref:neuropeptides capa receptor-like n=1 Tax=Battus philenor TaxID=42288 RepID=UPI0035CEA61B
MSTEVTSEFNIEQWSQFLARVRGEEPTWSIVLSTTILLVIFFVSLVGNVLTCFVIYYDKNMHTATNYYLFDLAISDLLATFALLFDLYEHLFDSYRFGYVACKLHFFFVILLWNNSILIMTALAVERYIAIWHPLMLKSNADWRRVMKVIAIVGIIAIMETLPEVWTVELVKTKKSSVCFTVPTPFARVVNGVLALVTFVIPLVIMTFVYVMIALKVNFAEKTNSRTQIFNHRDHRGKVNKLVTALTLSFLVCWLPFCIFRVLIFVYNMRQLMNLKKWWSIGQRVMFFHNWFSIVLNPILFSLMSTKFRKSLKLRIKKLWTPKCDGLELQRTFVI